jgi:flagellar hook-associated protein 1
MGSLFEIAKSGIQTYRQALAVTGQNIANVNTEGYSKRDVSLEELGGIQGGVTDVSDQTGLGVRVEGIRRSFNAYIDERLRSSHSTYEQLDQFSKEVTLLEDTLLPDGSDLSTYIGKFFSSLQEVAAAPEDAAPRVVSIETGKDLANAFKDYSERLESTQKGVISQVNISVKNINTIASQISNVNAKLKSAGATTSPNDLLDTRDFLMEELSKEIEFTSDFGTRGDVTIKLGSSGQGPVIVSPNKSFQLKAKVTTNADFRYSFETTVNSISLFITEGTKETSTTQITGGKLAGLVNFYAYTQEIKGSIDDLAYKVANDFNNAQKNGRDLNGKIGKDMFLIGMPSVSTKTGKNSNLTANLSQINSIVSFSKEVNLTYNKDDKTWVGDNNKIYRGNEFSINGVLVSISGQANNKDIITINPSSSVAGSLNFNLTNGRDFAASALKLVESNTNNLGDGELLVEGKYIETPSGLNVVKDIFKNTDTPTLATSFLKNGAVSSISNDIESITLKSYGLQPNAQYFISDDQAKTATSFALSLADGNSVSVSFASSDLGHKVTSVKDLADILNSGVSPGGTSFNFSSFGLIASGDNGKLIIASSTQNISSSSISTRSSGTINSLIKNPTASELESSKIQIFTREGQHIAGTPLKINEYASIINEKNGFITGASYSAEYLNGDYRNMKVTKNNEDGDYILYTGSSASRSSNPVSAETLSIDLFKDGIVDTTLSIPVSSSSAFTLKEFNENAAKFGIKAEGITRVLIDPISVITSGTVSMSIASGIKESASISATVLPNDLTNLVTAINRVKDVTGVNATLTTDKKRVLLENTNAEDIKITDFVAPNNTTATVLNQNYQATSASISLGSSSSVNSAVFTGTLKFKSSSDFEITSSDGSSINIGDASQNGLEGGMFGITRSITGESINIKPVSYGSADMNISASDGSYASKSTGTYAINLPVVNSASSSFSASISTGTLTENNSREIAKSILNDLREDSPDVRLVGSVLSSLPTDGTKLSINFEGQTYVLETKSDQVTITGGEEDRIKAFFTPVSGWTGNTNATEITSQSTLTVSSGNTFQIEVDGTDSGTVTLPAAEYISNTAVAAALQSAINSDSTLSTASKSVTVSWTGQNYEIVSNTGQQTYNISNTTVASIKISTIDSTIDNNLKLSNANGAVQSLNGYQLGIVAEGSISASQITFPSNTENTNAKTSLGLDASIKNIEGKAVTNNPANREYFDVDIKTGSYTSGAVTTVSSSSTLVISGTNTLQISVDDIASGTITMPTGTYTSNTSIANELEEAINDDSTLTSAGKSVSVLWTGSEYQIVSKTGTTDASIGITSVTTNLEAHLKLTATNGGVESDSSRYRVKYTDAAWIGAAATTVNGSSNLVVAASGNTFQLSVDGTASGSITLPAATYTSNGDIAEALQTAINTNSNISGASKSVEVKWTGTAYKIISNGTSSQDVTVTSVDSAIEAKLKLTSSNGGAANDYSFDLYDGSGNGAKRQTFLNNINFQWDSVNKNISITRKLDSAPLNEISFIEDATNNEKFGIKVYPHTVALVNDEIKITSGTGEAVDVSVTANSNISRVGENIKLENLPQEELIIVMQGGGTARMLSASFTENANNQINEQNLQFDIDTVNNKLIIVKDADTGHKIAERTITENGKFKVAGYDLKLNGEAKLKDSFKITDNFGGVGDGRNIHNMLKLQEEDEDSLEKGNFQAVFSEIVSSVGATVKSAELNLSSAELIRDASANAASELSGVNMDDEAAQLIEYQQAYQASARVLQTARELFDTLIDRI